MVFRSSGSRTESTAFFLNEHRDLDFRVSSQFHFDPLSGWDGEKSSYDLPTQSVLDRTLLLNPYALFGFLDIRIVPGDLDPTMVASTDVHLHYDHEGVWARDKVITIQPNSDTQHWKLRLSDPNRRNFSYKFIHHLLDGSASETEFVEATSSTVVVNDPFEDPLIIEFFANYDASDINTVFVKVTYEDIVNQFERTQELRFVGNTQTSQRLRFARLDPSLDRYSYAVTVLGNDNSVTRRNKVDSTDTIVFLGSQVQSELSESVLSENGTKHLPDNQNGVENSYQTNGTSKTPLINSAVENQSCQDDEAANEQRSALRQLIRELIDTPQINQ